MPPVQTGYLINSPPAFPGMDFHHNLNSQTSAIQGETSAEIPFGVFVARATSADHLLKPKVLLPAASTDFILGAVLFQHTYIPERALGTVGVKPKEILDVRTSGALWVLCEQAMAVTDPVYVRFASGAGGSQKGVVRKTADTATAVLLKGARLLAPSSQVALPTGTVHVAPVYFDTQTIAATAS